jgi:hypothetical protein
MILILILLEQKITDIIRFEKENSIMENLIKKKTKIVDFNVFKRLYVYNKYYLKKWLYYNSANKDSC